MRSIARFLIFVFVVIIGVLFIVFVKEAFEIEITSGVISAPHLPDGIIAVSYMVWGYFLGSAFKKFSKK